MKTPLSILSWRLLAVPFAAGLLATACATAPPIELTNAQAAYARASAGPASQLVPSVRRGLRLRTAQPASPPNPR